jgi:hypothetical protein
MAITFYLLQIPPVLLFLLMASIGAILAGVSTFLFRKYVKFRVLRAHNEVTGFLFTAVAGIYAFLLGFVIVVVWGQLNDTQDNVSKEGSSALGLYRDIKYYPDIVESKQLMSVYLDFVYNVINEEIPNMAIMKASRRTPEAFNRVFNKMEHLNPQTPYQIQLVAEMFKHLNELSTYRGLRTASIDAEIPPPLWLPMILGGLITLICAMLVDVENKRLQVLLNTLLGTFIGMLFFIIILLDHPYTGSLSIKPESYKEIFTLEKWANETHLRK